MYILGLTTMGDAAATLIHDGQVVACAEEERFSRVKHHIGFPYESIRYVLSAGGIKLSDVAHTGIYWRPWILGTRIKLLLQNLGSPRAFGARFSRGSEQVSSHYQQMLRARTLLTQRFGPSRFKLHYVEHHMAHAASAFFVSPFERAAILTLDGTGESTTTLLAHGRGETISALRRVKLPHSIGQFYSAITNYLGFDMAGGDEWKVMGLAGWGEPRFKDFLLEHVLQPLPDGRFQYKNRLLDHHLARHYIFNEAFGETVGPPRGPTDPIEQPHMDLASSAQAAVEHVVLNTLGQLKAITNENALCMAGGVVYNSLMNGRIRQQGPFKETFFQPVAGDAGCSLGACYWIWHSHLKKPRTFRYEHGYWGPNFTTDQCVEVLNRHSLPHRILEESEIGRTVASILAEGHIVAWFNGRMEFGPRALGARSFIGDPRNANVREKLNAEVKLREWFRPLAPSMREEDAHLVFGQAYSDPFMITVQPATSEIAKLAPAIVHVDGTARPQTVARAVNPRYWSVIDEFKTLTGVPCILNTSFNIQEPIVCTPQDAIATFQRSGVKYLMLEQCLVTKE